MVTVDLCVLVQQLVETSVLWVLCNVFLRVIFDFVDVELKLEGLLGSKSWFSFPLPKFPCFLTSTSTIKGVVYE